ncbi:MAG: hypothetical protein ACYCQI_10740 [Gammaproteobacteria bacterium]
MLRNHITTFALSTLQNNFYRCTARLFSHCRKSKFDVRRIELLAQPPLTHACFELLKAAGATHYALFGGSIRDADYAKRYHQDRPIKDYDIRVWLPAENYEQHEKSFVVKLAEVANTKIVEVPRPVTGGVRHCLYLNGVELDISLKPIPDRFKNKNIPVEAVAIDRASESDIGLCSVAIDPSGTAWARPEFQLDQINKTLTVYPFNSLKRRTEYTQRMKEKFSDHRVVWLEDSNISKEEKPVFTMSLLL